MRKSDGLTRRGFLAGTAGITALSLASVHGEDSGMADGNGLFPPVRPEDVDIDGAGLQALLAYIDGECEAGHFPGAALVAIRGGKRFVSHFTGTYRSPVSAAVPYHDGVFNMLFSFSKVVSATAAMVALQEGKLDLDRPVAEVIPEFGKNGKERITPRHCLTHSAGIPDAPGLGPVYTDAEWEAGMRVVCGLTPIWAPGSRTHYHALTGKLIVADIIRRAYDGISWEAFCREKLLDPLGADTMSFRFPGDASRTALTPQPAEVPFELNSTTMPMAGHPAAGCLGTPEDMLRLLQMHLQGGVWRGKRILEPEVFEEMHRVQYAAEIQAALDAGETPTHEYWALGWLTRGATTTGWFGFGDQASPESFGHAGISTVIGIADPERDMAWAFLTTNSPADDGYTTALRNTVSNKLVRCLKA